MVLHGEHIGESKDYADREFSHMKYVNGYDDPEICAGLGVCGVVGCLVPCSYAMLACVM